MNKYILVREGDEAVSFLLDESGKAVEIHVDRIENAPAAGDIYIGRVQKTVSALHAAFVDILPGKTCYLPYHEISNPVFVKKGSCDALQAGDELVVQISREENKGKYPALTTNLTLQGEYAVLQRGSARSGISRKIDAQQYQRLKCLLDKIEAGEITSCALPENCSIILRTNAASAGDDQILAEISDLCLQLEKLIKTAPHHTCYSNLRSGSAGWIRRMSNLRTDMTESILTDDKLLYNGLKSDVSFLTWPISDRLRLEAENNWSLRARFRLDREMELALSKRVWLDNGAFLVIEQTEALNVIDVNSGKSSAQKKHRSKEEAALAVNLEAAAECARQIRLRNLSGIILIDFISMQTEESRASLMKELRELLKDDPVKTQLIDMTKLELVEITRKKTEKSLAETRSRMYDM